MRNLVTSLLHKSDFAKDALTLTLGTSIAQVVPMLFYPVLSRIYRPSEFGILATLSTLTSILTVLSTGNYENSILIAQSKKDAANITGLILSLSIVLLFVALLVLEVLSNKLSNLFNEPELGRWLFLCPISAFSIIIYNCFNEWCVRNKYFNILSINKITNSAATSLSKLLFGFIKFSPNGLILGDFIGRIISASGCLIRAWKKDSPVFRTISTKRMLALARIYKDFPRLTLPATLINTVGGAIPVLTIGAYFNSKEVGFYAMTTFVLSVPISIISLAIKDVFRQRANEEFIKYGSCDTIFRKLSKVLSLWSVLGSIPLFFALPNIFSLVLGEKWRIAGEYSQILLPMLAINFVCTSLSGVLIITKRMREVIYLEAYYTAITILSLFFGAIYFGNMKAVLVCFSIGRSSSYLLSLLISYKFSKGQN